MVVEPVSVRASTHSNMNISKTGPIAIKFYQKHYWGGGKVALGLGLMGLELWFPWQQIAPIDLQWEKQKKSPKPQGPELSYFVCSRV